MECDITHNIENIINYVINDFKNNNIIKYSIEKLEQIDEDTETNSFECDDESYN